VIRCFSQARQFRASGDLDSALAEAEKCLAAYPLDPRLAQLRDILSKERNDERRAKTRGPDLEEIRQLEQQAAAAATRAEMESVLSRARAVAGPYTEDPDFQRALAAIGQRLSAMPGAPAPEPDFAGATATSINLPGLTSSRAIAVDDTPTVVEPPPGLAASAAPPPVPPTVAGMPGMGAPPPPASGIFAVPTGLPPAAPPDVPPAAPPHQNGGPAGAVGAPPPPPHPPRKAVMSPAMLWALGGAALVLVLLIVVVVVGQKLRRSAHPVESTVHVEVRTWPPGATIRVNGKIRGTSNFQLEDAPGKYQVDAVLEGYQPASSAVELKRGAAAAPVELTLQPLPQTVRLITDLTDGKVTLDDQAPPRELQDGQVTFDAVPPGKHTLKLASRSGQAQFDFELVPGSVPQLAAPPVAKGVAGLVVSSFSNRAHVYSTLASAKVQLDGAPAGDAGPEGLEIGNLVPGAHELAVSDDKTQLKKVLETSAAPTLTSFFQSNQNVGTVVVLAGEDGADVLIDGKKYRRQTAGGGRLRIPREPKEYHVKVVKEGFEDVPEQVVQVAKGEEKKVVFKMVPLPTTAHLSLQGTPGAQVLIDQNVAGTVLPDGTFQVSNLSPGEHVIELRKEKQRSHSVRRAFAAGQTVTLADADVALRGGSGTLKLTVSPPGAVVTVTRAGRPPQTVNGASVELDEGAYTVAARAPGYAERSEPVQIAGGQTAAVNLALARVESKKTGPAGMDGWDKAAWTADGDWYVHRGADLLLYRAPAKPGTYAFNLMLSAGGGIIRGKTLEWVAGYIDEDNYVLFRLDKDDLRRFSIVKGKRVELPRKPHGLKLKDIIASVQVEVQPGAIITRLRDGEKWLTVDAVTTTDRRFSDGRFGIQIEGKDEVRLSRFGFYPKD
jgi:hypothetical protein